MLLLEVDGRAADSLSLEVDSDLYTIRDLDKRDTAVHAVLLAVEGHGSRNCARAGPFTSNREF